MLKDNLADTINSTDSSTVINPAMANAQLTLMQDTLNSLTNIVRTNNDIRHSGYKN